VLNFDDVDLTTHYLGIEGLMVERREGWVDRVGGIKERGEEGRRGEERK
jgi:hypothetical protein